MDAKKYTFNYQIVNKVGVEIVISYSEFGWKEEINLSPEDILDWYRVFQAIKEPVFTIRASIKGGGMNFLIAGQIEYILKPMSEENLIIVLPVTAESKYLFYISTLPPFHECYWPLVFHSDDQNAYLLIDFQRLSKNIARYYSFFSLSLAVFLKHSTRLYVVV